MHKGKKKRSKSLDERKKETVNNVQSLCGIKYKWTWGGEGAALNEMGRKISQNRRECSAVEGKGKDGIEKARRFT